MRLKDLSIDGFTGVCPKCEDNSDGEFWITVHVEALFDSNGIINMEELGWSRSSRASCNKCGYVGIVLDFESL